MTKRDQQYRDYCAEHHEAPVRHTRGPWSVSYESFDGNGLRWVNVIARDAVRQIALVAHADTHEGGQNARLIATAPEMLARLEKIVNAPPDSPRLYDEIESAIPVILKAKGLL